MGSRYYLIYSVRRAWQLRSRSSSFQVGIRSLSLSDWSELCHSFEPLLEKSSLDWWEVCSRSAAEYASSRLSKVSSKKAKAMWLEARLVAVLRRSVLLLLDLIGTGPRMGKLLHSNHARFRRCCFPLSIQAKWPFPFSRAFPNHSLVLTLRLFPNERSPSSIAEKAGTKEWKIWMVPVQLFVGTLGSEWQKRTSGWAETDLGIRASL